MKTKHIFPLLLALLIATFSSCNPAKTKKATGKSKTTRTHLRYAHGFTVKYFNSYTEVTVRNPWDTTKILQTYLLVDRDAEKPANLPEGVVIKTPIQTVAVCTAVHAGILKQLDKVDNIVAVCEPEFIDLPEIKDGLAEGKVINLGLATAIDLEQLIAASPEALIVSPFENSSYGRFEKTGVPVVIDASYMEESPLGRAEWIKFEALFTGEEQRAEEIFSKIEAKYNKLAALARQEKDKPTVFTEKKYGQVWYVPGGNSYMGRFLEDAGADYLWANMKNAGSTPLSFETVYAKAEKAQYWLIKYNDAKGELTYPLLQKDYELYKQFDAFRNKNVFACNSAKTPFYEEGPMEPDVILADLVKIFHPELLPDYQPKYYFKLK
ncbi:MAG: ABC transporter substrate-binding protein [Bacteroidota bacterium]|nr:ABC transporter substrate-binding protein [Bacteroidota bacterium]